MVVGVVATLTFYYLINPMLTPITNKLDCVVSFPSEGCCNMPRNIYI